MPLKNAAVRIPPLPSYSSLRHSQMPQGHDVVETVRPETEALPSHIVTSKARTVLLINRLLSFKPSCLMNDDCSGATSKCVATCARSACASNFARHLPVGANTVKVGIPTVFPVHSRHVTGAPCGFSRQPLDHEITRRRDKLHPQHLTRIPLNTVAANLALPRLRYHDSKCAVVKGMQRDVGFGTRMALRDVRVRRCQHQRACATTVFT